MGILESVIIKQTQMKEKERRTRKLLKSKLCCRKLIKGINTCADHFIRYSETFLKWTKEELGQMGQSTIKLMMVHKALHPRNERDRLYVSIKEGWKELDSIEELHRSKHSKTWAIHKKQKRKTNCSSQKQKCQHDKQLNKKIWKNTGRKTSL